MRARKKDRRRYKREQRLVRLEQRRINYGLRKAMQILTMSWRLRVEVARELGWLDTDGATASESRRGRK